MQTWRFQRTSPSGSSSASVLLDSVILPVERGLFRVLPVSALLVTKNLMQSHSSFLDEYKGDGGNPVLRVEKGFHSREQCD